MNRARLMGQLVIDEGLELKPYRCTAGKLTIGVGRNLDDLGISRDEAMYLLRSDVSRVEMELVRAMPWTLREPEAVREALMNMAFNLGIPRLQGFQRMLGALRSGNYERAAAEALDSRWAEQVGQRAVRIADQIKKGARV